MQAIYDVGQAVSHQWLILDCFNLAYGESSHFADRGA